MHNILLRNPAESDPETALVDARYRLATGEESEAEEISAAVFEQSGSTSPAAKSGESARMTAMKKAMLLCVTPEL